MQFNELQLNNKRNMNRISDINRLDERKQQKKNREVRKLKTRELIVKLQIK